MASIKATCIMLSPFSKILRPFGRGVHCQSRQSWA